MCDDCKYSLICTKHKLYWNNDEGAYIKIAAVCRYADGTRFNYAGEKVQRGLKSPEDYYLFILRVKEIGLVLYTNHCATVVQDRATVSKQRIVKAVAVSAIGINTSVRVASVYADTTTQQGELF